MNKLENYFTPLAIKMMEENDISIKKLASRLVIDDDLDKAFSFNNRGRKTSYPKWAFMQAKENGISRQLLYHRVKIQGIPIEKAVLKKTKGQAL